jgi:ceramide glucosyltransferase
VVVETYLPAYTMREFFAHQLRWARGVRDARASGYLGLIFTFGLSWGVLAFASSRAAWWGWVAVIIAASLRFAVALATGGLVLRDSQILKNTWLIPLRDFLAVGIWIVSLHGHTVIWRGERLTLKDGKINQPPP